MDTSTKQKPKRFLNCRVFISNSPTLLTGVEIHVSSSGIITYIGKDLTKERDDTPGLGCSSLKRKSNTESDDEISEPSKTKALTVDENEDEFEIIDCNNQIISPGFIDLQLNGAYGIDFSSLSTSHTDINTIRHKLLSHGVTSFYPTLISCDKDEYDAILNSFNALLSSPSTAHSSSSIGANILGLHLEGPFFSLSKKGAHNPTHIRDPIHGFTSFESIYGVNATIGQEGIVKIVTIAPELPGSLALISHLVSKGTRCSMGHSSATYEQSMEGVKAGCTCATHLFNAMETLHHRETGLIGVALGGGCGDDDDETTKTEKKIYFSLIPDGIHSHPSALKLAYSANPSRCLLITDAMPGMGLSDGTHKLGSMSVTKVGNKATIEGTNTLAGSVVSMDVCVRSFRKFTGCSVVEVLELCTGNPARFMSIEEIRGVICVGAAADFVLLDDSLVVLKTWVGGVEGFGSGCRKEGN